MPGVGFETWFPKKCPTVFCVKNITKNKAVRVFQVPIPPGRVYDLLKIPVVSEADIRHSLLKGELMNKIMTNEIEVVESNINLVTFDECHKEFLKMAGVQNGIDNCEGCESGDGYILPELPYIWKQNIELIGVKNGANRVFEVLPGDKFLNGNIDGNEFKIIIRHNGRTLLQNIDFVISESGGVGTGFDTIRLIDLLPNTRSKLYADYVIQRIV